MDAAASQLSLFPERSAADEAAVPRIDVRRSGRAKRLSIKVFPRGRVEVVAPRRARAGDVSAFVDENRDWIARAVASFGGAAENRPASLPVRVSLPAIEREFIVAYRPSAGADNVRYRESGHTVILSGATAEPERCLAALRRWLASVARRELGSRLRTLSTETGLAFGKTQVRAQRTCWGSRSSSGTISLNLCLLFLRPRVVRYLMVHELCHGRHMDHSPRFWGLVRRHEPRYRQLDRELGDGWRSVPEWLELY